MVQLPDTPYADMTPEERVQATTFARHLLRASYEHFRSELVASLRARLDNGEFANARALDDAIFRSIDASQLQSTIGVVEAVHFSNAGPYISNLQSTAAVAVRDDLHAELWPRWHARMREQQVLSLDEASPKRTPKV